MSLSSILRLALAATAAATALAGSAAAEQAPEPSLFCGKVHGVDESVFDVLVYGSASCGDAKRVMRDYFNAARAGKCSGNTCRAKIRRHSCVATPASADTDVAATCTRKNKTVVATD